MIRKCTKVSFLIFLMFGRLAKQLKPLWSNRRLLHSAKKVCVFVLRQLEEVASTRPGSLRAAIRKNWRKNSIHHQLLCMVRVTKHTASSIVVSGRLSQPIYIIHIELIVSMPRSLFSAHTRLGRARNHRDLVKRRRKQRSDLQSNTRQTSITQYFHRILCSSVFISISSHLCFFLALLLLLHSSLCRLLLVRSFMNFKFLRDFFIVLAATFRVWDIRWWWGEAHLYILTILRHCVWVCCFTFADVVACCCCLC